MKTGIELISQEREEQINKHNRSIEKDVDWNYNKELSEAAWKLLSPDYEKSPERWGDGSTFNKMQDKSYYDRLIIAGALIAAELDRLSYKPMTTSLSDDIISL